MKAKYGYKEVTIASGITSAEVDLQGLTPVGIVTPASINSATLTLYGSEESGGTFTQVCDEVTGAAYTLTIASSKRYKVDVTYSDQLQFMKLETSASETAKTFRIITRSIS